MALLEIEPLHVDVDTAVDGRVGAGEDADDGEGVVDEAIVGAVGGRKGVTDGETKPGGHAAAEDPAEKLIIAKVASGGEGEGAAVAHGERVEVGGVGADDAKAAEVISHADRHRLGHAAGVAAGHPVGAGFGRQELLVEPPGDVFDRLADEVDAVEHKLQRASLRSHDQVVAEAPARGEGIADQPADDERRHDQGDAQRQREGRQPAGEEPLPDISPGDAEERHGIRPPAFPPG